MRYLRIVICILSLAALIGCATNGNLNPLAQTSATLDPYVETLSADWPKASGLIRGAIGVDNLPQSIVAQLDEVDSWWLNDDGTWKDSIEMSVYQKWYIAGVRYSHTGPVLKVLLERFAPGLLAFPEVMGALGFMGL